MMGHSIFWFVVTVSALAAVWFQATAMPLSTGTAAAMAAILPRLCVRLEGLGMSWMYLSLMALQKGATPTIRAAAAHRGKGHRGAPLPPDDQESGTAIIRRS